MPRCSFKTATQKDAAEFFGQQPAYTFKGIAATEGEKIIGIGGLIYSGGRVTAFSDMKPEMRKYKKDMALTCRMIVAMIKAEPRKVYAVAQEDEPTSAYLLIKLGFRPTGEFSSFGEIMRWEGE